MNISIEKISENRFEELTEKLVFQNENSTRFALVGCGGAIYCVGWRSAEVDLDVRVINDHYFSIGIDQFFAIVGIDSWKILVKKHLDFFYMESVLSDGKAYFFSEMSTFMYSAESCEFITEVDHPDVYQAHVVEDGKVIVECMNGDNIVVG